MDSNLVKQNELARSPETLSGFDRTTEERLLNAVAAMFGNLNVYGRKWAPVIGQGWLMALRVAQDVTPEEFQYAVCRWMASEKDFPAPAAVIGWIRQGREVSELKAALRATEDLSRAECERMASEWRERHPDATGKDAFKAVGELRARPMPEARNIPNTRKSLPPLTPAVDLNARVLSPEEERKLDLIRQQINGEMA